MKIGASMGWTGSMRRSLGLGLGLRLPLGIGIEPHLPWAGHHLFPEEQVWGRHRAAAVPPYTLTAQG